MLMDFFYEVANAASLAEYINYVCPVPNAQAQIRKDAAKLTGSDKSDMEALASSPLVFPGQVDYAKLHYYVSFESTAEQQQFQKTFDPIVLG
jgi:spermidine/putrescine transport system substrate-binding protein